MNVKGVSANFVTKQNNLKSDNKVANAILPAKVLNAPAADTFEKTSNNSVANGSAANVSFNGAVGFFIGMLTPIAALIYAMAESSKFVIK